MRKKIIFILVLLFGISAGIGTGLFYVSGTYLEVKNNIVVAPTIPATEPPTTTPLAEPANLKIPKLKIEADIEAVTVDKEGNMDVPKQPNDAAWYSAGYVPGQPGNAVIAGHLDWYTGPAIFYDLASLRTGDEIIVENKNGKIMHFKVTAVETYPYDDFPLIKVFGSSSAKNLNLVTCAGKYDKKSKIYSKRVVVYSQLEE